MFSCARVSFPACTIFSPYFPMSWRGLTSWSNRYIFFGLRVDRSQYANHQLVMMAKAA
jgi:hypothetical protein